jgi:hypothetical protein
LCRADQVDPIEYLVASLLDVNKDGVLSEEEKKNAAVLVERLRKHYVTGLDVRWLCGVCDSLVCRL